MNDRRQQYPEPRSTSPWPYPSNIHAASPSYYDHTTKNEKDEAPNSTTTLSMVMSHTNTLIPIGRRERIRLCTSLKQDYDNSADFTNNDTYEEWTSNGDITSTTDIMTRNYNHKRHFKDANKYGEPPAKRSAPTIRLGAGFKWNLQVIYIINDEKCNSTCNLKKKIVFQKKQEIHVEKQYNRRNFRKTGDIL
ncbi:hypothetical protein evm_013971 [Chilo suppressalis]|nr:hypothetical protein evm_013971 [Chilo suppressalis]